MVGGLWSSAYALHGLACLFLRNSLPLFGIVGVFYLIGVACTTYAGDRSEATCGTVFGLADVTAMALFHGSLPTGKCRDHDAFIIDTRVERPCASKFGGYSSVPVGICI